jgi:hypothetical protein
VEPISVIVSALAAAVPVVARSEAVRDAYSSLRSVLARKLAGRPSAQAVLEKHAEQPNQWSGALEAELASINVGADRSVVQTAQHLIELIDESANRSVDTHYDIFLSYAGEDREYVRKVASALRERGVRVWYDEYEKASLSGKNLSDHLQSVMSASKYILVFHSEAFERLVASSVHDLAAVSRSLASSQRVVPVRLGQTALLDSFTQPSINAERVSADTLAELVAIRIGLPLEPTLGWPNSPGEDVGFALDTPWSDRLLQLAALETGWLDDEDGAEIEFGALRTADAVLRLIDAQQRHRPGIFPMPNGGVQLEWSTGSKVVSIEIEPSGQIDVLSFDSETDVQTENHAKDIESAVDIAMRGLTK